MRRVRTYITVTSVLVLLGSGALSAGPSPRLRVDLAFRGRQMPQLLEATAVKEATLIWARYGVELGTCGPDSPGRDGAITIDVVLADRQEEPLPDNALGSIVFQDGAPGSEIRMYPDAIAALVAQATVMERNEREWPTILRYVVLGRVLGRALAHEIGHFLLRSRGHSQIGLMRANQSIADLAAPERFRFYLSPDEVARLVTATSAVSGTRVSR